MIFKNSAPSHGELNGFLDQGSRCNGELQFEHTMRIDGYFRGKIVSPNELIVGEGAQIDAEIHVGRISVSGEVRGAIIAAQRVELHAKARALCDIQTPVLVMEEGALFQGNCSMGVAEAAPEPAIGEDSTAKLRAVKKA